MTSALHLTVPELSSLASKMKLPVPVVLRLADMIIYCHMEAGQLNHKVHDTYRIAVKKRLYVRCMKVYPELFKGKK